MGDETIKRLYQAYRNVSAERQRTSVPIDAVIKEAGLWENRESATQALLENRELLRLDEGDWASASLDTKAVHLTDPMRTKNRHGRPELRKLTMVAFTEEPRRDGPRITEKEIQEVVEAIRRAGNQDILKVGQYGALVERSSEHELEQLGPEIGY
jgi:hypothetical protein